MDNPLDGLVDRTGSPPDLVWRGVGIGAGMLGALVARQVIQRVRAAQGKAGQRPGKIEAVLWTALVGASASLGRTAAQRTVSAVWTRRAAKAA